MEVKRKCFYNELNFKPAQHVGAENKVEGKKFENILRRFKYNQGHINLCCWEKSFL